MRSIGLALALWATVGWTYNYAPQPRDGVLTRWIALGDSFSAGPGTGDPVPEDEGICFRRYGAYAPQLHRSDLFRKYYGNPEYNFLSCTGSTTAQVAENQLRYVDNETSLVTLSMCGNDVLFYNVLIACVFNAWHRWGDCDAALQNTTATLYSEDMWKNWHSVTSNISDTMSSARNGTIRSAPNRTAVYQTAYPPFFDSWTTQCNDAWFFPTAGPRLTNTVRTRMNLIGQELNAAIASWIDEYNGRFEQSRKVDVPSFMKFVNQDEHYNGHRFCREGVIEPDRNNRKTWFFNFLSKPDHATNQSGASLDMSDLHKQQVLRLPEVDPESCDPYPQDGSSGTQCAVAKAAAKAELGIDSHSPLNGESIEKTFHPRYRGFKATTKELKSRLRYTIGEHSTLRNNTLRIMCVGDSIAVGAGEDTQHNSYRPALNKLLISANNSVEFVGSQTRGDRPTNHIEGYLAALIPDIHRRLERKSAIANYRPNVIIITAGSADLRGLDPNDSTGLNETRSHLESLLAYLSTECQRCVILVGDIPPLSNNFSWPPVPRQRQALQFNAMISEVVNKLQTQQKANHNSTMVTKVHFTPAAKDIYSINGYPTNDGYLKMAYDIHEKLWDANERGWIHKPETDRSLSTTNNPYWNTVTRFLRAKTWSNYLQLLFNA